MNLMNNHLRNKTCRDLTYQKVHGQVDVLDQLFIGHANVSDGNAQAQNLETIKMTI